MFAIGGVVVEKAAVTVWALSKVNVQDGSVPLHPPSHGLKEVPSPGVAVKVTAVPLGKSAVHEPVGQSIPAGVLVTDPLPSNVTDNETGGGGVDTKVAVAL